MQQQVRRPPPRRRAAQNARAFLRRIPAYFRSRHLRFRFLIHPSLILRHQKRRSSSSKHAITRAGPVSKSSDTASACRLSTDFWATNSGQTGSLRFPVVVSSCLVSQVPVQAVTARQKACARAASAAAAVATAAAVARSAAVREPAAAVHTHAACRRQQQHRQRRHHQQQQHQRRANHAAAGPPPMASKRRRLSSPTRCEQQRPTA